ncbi:hypothetical protein K443DRAFT_10781 [Laccaria amethystina LaAM-08-1]|uniref:Uncharacterized protein n=1 Tax=Laccaria amethystina LaAM-08-1 TaxID=1095629 RepID=A0A0C9WV01_9AGAR|nr:hypothetical protein K443DRAFT_10781 [Laccaria amethystina LaAM-08-1]
MKVDGRPQQYAVLAKHIFENDTTQSALYAANPARFVTSVETRLRRLKAEYSKYVKDIGATGAGLDPEEVTPGTTVTVDWPWWSGFHSFWRELPNYSPVAVESSTPGVDHAAEAIALFDVPGGEAGEVFGDDGSAELGVDEGEKSDEGEDFVEEAGGEHKDNAADPTLSSEPAPHQSLNPAPPPPTKFASTPISKVQPKLSKVKTILGGRDGGLAKANAAKSTAAPKNAIDRFNETRQQEAQHIDRKHEREHEFRMEQERNKRLKYELKYGGKAKVAADERASRREELLLQLEIARLNAQMNQPLTLPTTPLAATPSTAPTSFPLTPVSRLPFGDFNSPTTLGQASGSSSSMLGKTGGSGGKEH